MTIGKNIKRIRKEKHVNMNMLSFRTKYSESELRKFESDKAVPSFAQIRAIAAALDVNTEDITG